MNDYGKGQVLSAATALPTTAGAGILLINHANPVIVAGLFMVSAVSFIVLIGTISRFIINSRRNK